MVDAAVLGDRGRGRHAAVTMAEPALRDGYLTPTGLPRGECTVTRFYVEDGSIRLRINHADPRVLISAELLAEVYIAPSPGVSLSPECPGGRGYGVGAVLRIEGVNCTVIYRITEYVPAVHGYIGEWPD
jgi:hypothetical protein